MKNFVLIVITAVFYALFAVDNTIAVPLKFATFSIQVPLSLAIIIPLGTALLLFALYHIGKMRKSDLVIHDLEDNVESAQKEIVDIVKRTHELEIENRKLKIRLGEEDDQDEQSL